MSSPQETMHCPTDETLAAFIDGRLEGEARERIVEHLVMCDSCHAVWQSAAEFQAAEAPGNVVKGRFGRGWVWAGVAVAAALVALVFLGPMRDRLTFGRPSGMRALVVASQETPYRPFEPRLSADFPYKELKLKTRGDGDDGNLRIEAAATDVLADAAERPMDPRAVAAASLFLRQWNAAVETLEKALVEETGAGTAIEAIAKSRKADLLNDTAVAYLERGRREKRPVDFERALEAADRAWKLDPKPATAFNRALALEALTLREDAKSAWNDYLKLDSTSPWAREADEHLATLSSQGRSERWESLRDSISPANAAREFPQQYREHIQSNVLIQWGVAVRGGNEALAGQSRALLRNAAAVSTDPVISEVARSIDDAPNAVAEALEVYSEAESLYTARSAVASAELYVQAARLFEAQRNPFAEVAALRAASARNLAGDYKGSLRGSRDLLSRTTSASVRGMTQRLAGLNELALGRPYESVLIYRQALATFRDLGENDNVAAVHNSLAEAFDYLGDEESASHERYQALVMISEEGKFAKRLLHILNAAGRAAIERGHYVVAELYLSRQVAAAKSRNDESFVINGLLWRGVLTAKRGSDDAADQLIDEAVARTAALPADRAYRAHVLSNVNYVRAIAHTSRNPEEQLGFIDDALRYANETSNNFRAASLWLERGRLNVTLGRTADAEASFRSGVELLTRESGTVLSDVFRGRHFDARRELYEEWIELALDDRTDEAFAIADDLKSRAFLSGAHIAGLVEPASYRARLRPEQALIVYVVLGGRSAVWSLRRDTSSFALIPAGNGALAASTTRFLTALQKGRRSDAAVLGRAIHRTIVEPIEKSLGGATEVTFVPDGPLVALPFTALRAASGRTLTEQWLVSNSPSCATFFEPIQPRSRERTVLIVGDPEFDPASFPDLERLPGAAAEARVLGEIHRGAVVATGASATPARLREGFATYDLIVYAGHSLVNDNRPEDSALVLAPSGDSGILYVWELREMQCRAQLVVLNSCSSARQRSGRATAASLVTGVLASGAGAVVGALWDIGDAEARKLMESFHRNLVAGHRPAVALQLAQLADMREGGTGWAAFRISGREAAL